MITVFHGELLINPVPLEFSGNRCSYGCRFCYATLAEPERRVNVKQIMRQLAEIEERDTLEAQLLRTRYPVIFSNRTDPFAPPNAAQTLAMLEVFGELGLRAAFQTRGGKEIDVALALVRPSVWYISVNCQSEAMRERLEPRSPTLASRFDLMQKLIAHGHRVVVGLNPFVPEWLPDPRALLDRLKASGAEGLWMEALHFSKKQVPSLTPEDLEAIDPAVVARAQQRRVSRDVLEAFWRVSDMARDRGLEIFTHALAVHSAYFRPYQEAYERVYPTLSDFTNALFEEGPKAERRLISFEEFSSFMLPSLPAGAWPMADCLGPRGGVRLRGAKVPNTLTYADLLLLLWTYPKLGKAVARSPLLSYACERGADGQLVQLVDADGLPYMLFSASGHDSLYVEVPFEVR